MLYVFSTPRCLSLRVVYVYCVDVPHICATAALGCFISTLVTTSSNNSINSFSERYLYSTAFSSNRTTVLKKRSGLKKSRGLKYILPYLLLRWPITELLRFGVLVFPSSLSIPSKRHRLGELQFKGGSVDGWDVESSILENQE